jgi:hypothetical protein
VRIAVTAARVAVASGRGSREAAVAAPGWAGALEALAGLLGGAAPGGRASVTLSHQFAPVHLLPPPPVALKAVEMQGWIRDALARQFGEAGRDARVAWQAERPGEPFIACSLAPAGLADIEATLRAASLKLARVQPWFAVAWNRRRRRLGNGPAWFAAAEPGRLTLAGLAGGRVRSLRTMSVQGDAVAALGDLLAREALLAHETTPAPLWIESALPPLNWQTIGRPVHPFAGGGEALAAMLDT